MMHMGDEAPVHSTGRRSGDGLEFVGAPKRSLFRQYTARFQTAGGRVRGTPDDAKQATTHQSHTAHPSAASSVTDRRLHAHHAQDHTRADKREAALQPAQQVAATAPPPPNPVYEQPAAVDDSYFAEPIAAELDEMEIDEAGGEPAVTIKHPSAKTDKARRKTLLKRVLLTIIVFACLAILAVSSYYLLHNKPLISDSLRKEAGFPLYAPVNSRDFSIDRSTVKMGENSSVVFTVTKKDNGAHFVVSQQKLPELIKDDDHYIQFLAQIDKFADFTSSLGKTYLTKPANIGDDITAVVKNESSIIFIRGPGTTTDEEWGKVTDLLKLYK